MRTLKGPTTNCQVTERRYVLIDFFLHASRKYAHKGERTVTVVTQVHVVQTSQ